MIRVILRSKGDAAMNTKNCPHCDVVLPEESAFCLYCMNKLTEEEQVTPIKRIPRKSINKWVFAALCVVVLLTAGITVLLLNPKNEQPEPPGGTNYKKYIGIWDVDDPGVPAHIYTDGGIRLQILSVKDNTIRFHLVKVSSPPANRVAQLENAAGEIVDGIIYFTFKDDGWGNAGTGTIQLNNDRVYVDVKITDRNDNAYWDLLINTRFKKVEEESVSIEYLLGDFNIVKNMLGSEYTDERINDMYSSYHYDDGLVLAVDPDTDAVRNVSVEYRFADNKAKYHYNTLNGKSSYEDVISMMGEPVYSDLNHVIEKIITYEIQGKGVKFFLDEDLVVIGIMYFWPE